MQRSRATRRTKPVRDIVWYFLSFADGYSFRGAVIIPGSTCEEACANAQKLGLYPVDAEVLGTPLDLTDLARIPEDLRRRLLTEAEVCEHLDGRPM